MVDGRWRVDALLGWGSTSAVYAATHRNGHRAALKILHQALCADLPTTERFLREAGIANAIKHRAVVPISDDGITSEGCAYLVVELLEGDTLEALRERSNGRIDLRELAPIADELMSALSAVHAAGVVHRDLKPQNVFLTASGALKLLDFGTARILDRDAGSSVSIAGMVVGTPAFMSPEQARGARAEVDAQSDVWSLGAMFFTILSGEDVHGPSRDAQTRLLAAASREARKLGDVVPTVDDGVARVVDRALAHAKEDRWPDVRSMRAAFRHAVAAAVTTPSDGALTRPTASPMAAVEPWEGSLAPASESGMFGVSSTQAVRRVKVGIPLPALATGCGVMAAVVLLVMFFVSGGDESSARAAASRPTEPHPVAAALPTAVVAPAASFIVVEAPDEPTPQPLPAAAPNKPLLAPVVAPAPKAAAVRSDAGAPAIPTEPAAAGRDGEGATVEPEPTGPVVPVAALIVLP